MAKRKKTETVYQLKITLKGSRPSIWRKVLINPDLPLEDLHKIIQTTMGWTNSHLHQFWKDRTNYYLEINDFGELPDNSKSCEYCKTKVSDLLKKEKDKIEYEYDFGDSWNHVITLEKVLPFDDTEVYPVCIDGKRHCPPEDCGGLWGFYNMLEILKDPQHEEYEEYLEWLGEEFEPEYFDKKEVNLMLKEVDYGCNFFF